MCLHDCWNWRYKIYVDLIIIESVVLRDNLLYIAFAKTILRCDIYFLIPEQKISPNLLGKVAYFSFIELFKCDIAQTNLL